MPGLGIEPLGAALEAFGYKLRDFYTFPRTHLLAAWYAPPQELYGVLPRMFVSQLQVGRWGVGSCRDDVVVEGRRVVGEEVSSITAIVYVAAWLPSTGKIQLH